MKVKVILKENIKGVGKKDEVIEVKDGYANNFLFTQNKAIPATTENLNKLKNKKDKILKNDEKELKNANELKAKLETSKILLKVKAGTDGKIYGSLGAKEIEIALKEQLDINIDKKKFGNDVRIKALGMHNIQIKLYKDIKATLKVEVISL